MKQVQERAREATGSGGPRKHWCENLSRFGSVRLLLPCQDDRRRKTSSPWRNCAQGELWRTERHAQRRSINCTSQDKSGRCVLFTPQSVQDNEDNLNLQQVKERLSKADVTEIKLPATKNLPQSFFDWSKKGPGALQQLQERAAKAREKTRRLHG